MYHDFQVRTRYVSIDLRSSSVEDVLLATEDDRRSIETCLVLRPCLHGLGDPGLVG